MHPASRLNFTLLPKAAQLFTNFSLRSAVERPPCRASLFKTTTPTQHVRLTLLLLIVQRVLTLKRLATLSESLSMVDSTMLQHCQAQLRLLTLVVGIVLLNLVTNLTLLKRPIKWVVQTLIRTLTVVGSQISLSKAMERGLRVVLLTPSTKTFW